MFGRRGASVLAIGAATAVAAAFTGEAASARAPAPGAEARTYALADGTMVTRLRAAAADPEPGYADTTLRDGSQANVSYASTGTLYVGQSATTAATNGRALLRYDVAAAVPAEARVLSSALRLTPIARQNSQAKRVDVHALTRAFTPAATWNRYDGANAWTTPGGDFAATPAASATVRGDEFWSSWDVSALVAAWHEGRAPNHGVIVRDAPGQPRNAVTYGSADSSDYTVRPFLEIHWVYQTGELPAYHFERWVLEDGSVARVNVANGNLLLSAEDLSGVGPGRTVSWTRHFNSLATSTTLRASLRDWWRLEYDARLLVAQDHIAFVGPDGATVAFHRAASGAWADANDSGLQLTSTTAEHRVEDPLRGVTWVFDTAGTLDHQLDREGRRIDASPLTDTDGFVWTSSWPGSEAQIVNGPAGTARYQYGYYGYDKLMTVEANGHRTLYEHHPNTGPGQLEAVVVDGVHRTGVDLSPQGRVLGLTRNGATTTFAYHTGRTVMTRPDGSTRTYHYDPRTLRVLRIVDGNGPEVSVSGELWMLRGVPFAGARDLRVTATSSSTAAGDVRISVSVDEDVQGQNTLTPCASACTVTRDLAVEGSDFVDGPNVVQVDVTDQQGRTTRVEWVVTVDPGDEYSGKVVDEPDDLAEDAFGDGVDDVCLPDPEGLADYCSADDAANTATQEVLAEAEDEVAARMLAAPAPSLRPGGSGWGIADEKAQTFTHPRFAEFQFRRARKIVPWDAVLIHEARTADESPYPGQMDCRIVNGRRQCEYCDNYRREARTRCRWRGQELFTVAELDDWMVQADRLNIEPLVAFGHSRPPRFFGYLPTRREYRAGVRAFLQRYEDPWPHDVEPADRKHFVPVFAAWNEPNHPTQPTARRFDKRFSRNGARQAALRWRDLMSICDDEPQSQCTVAAGEFLDTSKHLLQKGRDGRLNFVQDYIEALGSKPPFWSLHAYGTGFYKSAKRLRAFFHATRTRGSGRHAPVWLTEQGGYVQRYQNDADSNLSVAARERRANDHLEYLLTMPELPELQDRNWNRGRRITRFYHYQWFGDWLQGNQLHDTGLIRRDNEAFELRSPRSTIPGSNPPQPGVFTTYRNVVCPPSKPGCPA